MLENIFGLDPVALSVSLILILLSVSLFLSAFILWHRTQIDRSEAHLRERRHCWMPLVLGYLSDTTTVAEVAAEVSPRDEEAFADYVLHLLDSVEGDDVEKLRLLLDECGILRRYLADLAEHDRYRSIHAMIVLGRLRDARATEPLRALVQDPREEVGFVAASSLAALRDPRDLAIVFERITRDPNRSLQSVQHVLLDFGPSIAEGLAVLLHRHGLSPRQQMVLVEMLGCLEELSALPLVAGRLGSTYDPELRRRAARALGRFGSPEALPALHEVADDPDEQLRLEVMTALRRIGSDESVPVLSDRLEDPSPLVRHGAALALLQIGGNGRAAVERAALGASGPALSAREALAEWTYGEGAAA